MRADKYFLGGPDNDQGPADVVGRDVTAYSNGPSLNLYSLALGLFAVSSSVGHTTRLWTVLEGPAKTFVQALRRSLGTRIIGTNDLDCDTSQTSGADVFAVADATRPSWSVQVVTRRGVQHYFWSEMLDTHGWAC